MNKLDLNYLERNLKEVKREEVIKMLPGIIYYVYNPLTANVRKEITSEKDIVHFKHCCLNLRYFIEESEYKWSK